MFYRVEYLIELDSASAEMRGESSPVEGPFRKLGPGLLMAGAAIGVSHLVQSTRAGASFGFQLLILVLLINLLKYPFFEYGHRYTVATRESLLHGYRRMGRGFLYLYLVIQIIVGIIGIAGITVLTAYLAKYLLSSNWHLSIWAILILLSCVGILLLGEYIWLERIMKVIILLLVSATAAAFLIALFNGPVAAPDFRSPSPWNLANLGFLIALMGWMPAPIELAVFQSLWIGAKERREQRRIRFAEAIYDFRFGFLLSVALAVLFLALGALVMHGSGEEFSDQGTLFVKQLLNLYSETLGEWALPLIGLAAFTTMYSTTLTVIDATPRAISLGIKLAISAVRIRETTVRWIVIGVGFVIEVIVIHSLFSNLTKMIDMATILAFLVAPLLAFLNYRLITSLHTPKEMQPGLFMRILSWMGLVYLTGFSILYLSHRFLTG